MEHALEGWDWYNVYPCYEEPNVYDGHEAIGLRRYNFGWNIALDEKMQGKDIEVEEIEQDGYAWENPMIKLRLKGYRAPYLCAPYPCKTFETFKARQTVDIEREVELVPYGCTNLRITYFPRANLEKFDKKN